MFFIWLPRHNRTKYLLRFFAIIAGIFAGAALYAAWNVGDTVRITLFAAVVLALGVLLIVPRWLTALACVLVGGGAMAYDDDLKKQESAALQPVALEASEVVRPTLQSARQPADTVAIYGKILVWDVPHNRLSAAHYKLPAALRATAQDQVVTIFLLWKTESRQIGTYHTQGEVALPGVPDTGPAAYRDTSDLAVVAWPERRLLGWHAVVGADPPRTIQTSSGQPTAPQHGDAIRPIADWIQTLPGIGVAASTASAPISRPTAGSTPAPTPPWTEATAQKEAMRRYPQLGVSNSPMNHAFIEKYKQLKATNPAYLRDPAWPLRLADEVANRGQHP